MENNNSYVITRVPCSVERTIGALLSILFVVSLLANLTLIYTILKHKKLHTTMNYLNVCLALVNLYGILTELPLMIVNNFNCSFIFGRGVCLYMGFTLFSNGCSAMYTLTMISIERYLIICQPYKTFTFNTKRVLISISVMVLIVLIFAMQPLIGWSEYTFDYGHLMKVSIVSIASFALSYTPYFILALIRFATGYSEHSFYIFTIFLARCSLLWPPIVILFMNKDIKPFVFNTKKINHETTTGTA